MEEGKLDWMKYILIGLGVLLVFQWLRGHYRRPPELAAGGQPQQPQPQPQSASPQLQQQPQSTSTTPIPESTGTPPPDDVLKQAALDPSKASLAGGWRFSWHAWNYYRAQAAIEAGLCSPPCSEYAPVLGERFGLTDSQGITAGEYHAYLAQAGMGRLFWGRNAMHSSWRM
jgi:hypothetical protein